MDFELQNVYAEMENFLGLKARNLPQPATPINLRVQFKNGLIVYDRQNNQFRVEEVVLNTPSICIDKTFKVLRLQDWQFSVKFQGKQCKAIYLESKSIVFFATKETKKEFSDVLFRIPIVYNESGLKNLSPELNGYLLRLGKKFLIEQSKSIGQQFQSLPKQIRRLNYKSCEMNPEINSIDPITAIGVKDKKLLEVFCKFISREQILEYIQNQEISEESISQLQKLAFGGI